MVAWTKKQAIVAKSSAEAEFPALVHGIYEFYLFIYSSGINEPLWVKIIEMIGVLYSRNTAHNPVQYDRIKHIKFDRHLIKEKLDNGINCTPFAKTMN